MANLIVDGVSFHGMPLGLSLISTLKRRRLVTCSLVTVGGALLFLPETTCIWSSLVSGVFGYFSHCHHLPRHMNETDLKLSKKFD